MIGRATTKPARITVAVSGSFNRALDQVRRAVEAFQGHGAVVLSPVDPRPAGRFADFVYVHSDTSRAIRVLQQRHFAAIERSDLLWVCTPDGLLGDSTSAEIHHANMFDVPVYCDTVPKSLYWRQMVIPVCGISEALKRAGEEASLTTGGENLTFLLDPEEAAERAHEDVELVRDHLGRRAIPAADDPILRMAMHRIRDKLR